MQNKARKGEENKNRKKMVEINSNVSISKINVSGLNSPVRR